MPLRPPRFRAAPLGAVACCGGPAGVHDRAEGSERVDVWCPLADANLVTEATKVSGPVPVWAPATEALRLVPVRAVAFRAEGAEGGVSRPCRG